MTGVDATLATEVASVAPPSKEDVVSNATIPQDVADVQAAPAKERRFPPGSYDRKPQRIIDREWLVREDANGDRIVVELSCAHRADRKVFVAYISNMRAEHDHGYTVSVSNPMSTQRLAHERVDRYSKPRFEAFADQALKEFRERVKAGEFGEFVRGEHAPVR